MMRDDGTEPTSTDTDVDLTELQQALDELSEALRQALLPVVERISAAISYVDRFFAQLSDDTGQEPDDVSETGTTDGTGS